MGCMARSKTMYRCGRIGATILLLGLALGLGGGLGLAAEPDSGKAVRSLPPTPPPIGGIRRDANGNLVPIEGESESPSNRPAGEKGSAPNAEGAAAVDRAPACIALGSGPQIQVQSISESAGVNAQRSLEDLHRLGPGPAFHPLGIYRASLQHELKLEFGRSDLKSAKGKPQVCLWIERIRISIGFLPRTILIAREYPLGSCEYNAIFGHEMRHAQIDDAVLGDFLPKLRSRLRKIAAEASAAGTVEPAGVEQRKAELLARLQGTLQQAATELENVRRRGQGTIDTPSEYRRVADSCPSHLRPGR